MFMAAHRLEYARTHINWTQRQWKQVLFTDENHFCLFNNDRRIWRQRNERFNCACDAAVRAFHGGNGLSRDHYDQTHNLNNNFSSWFDNNLLYQLGTSTHILPFRKI